MTLTFPDRSFDGHIFDCDGTIVDSMPLHYEAWCAALEAHNAPYVFTELQFYQWAGRTETDVVAELNQIHGGNVDPVDAVRSKQHWFREHLHQLKSVPAVEAVVRQMAAEGKQISVASGSEMMIVEPELEVVGLRDLFTVIVTPERVKHGKPAPDMFLLAAKEMGVAPEDCLVYEDGQSGLDAAAAAGMDTVFIPSAADRLAELEGDR